MRADLAEFLSDVWQMREARIVIGLAVVAILVTVLIYLVQRLRGLVHQPIPGALDYLGEFREMKEEGAIDQEEFDRLKTTLTDKAVRQVKDTDTLDFPSNEKL